MKKQTKNRESVTVRVGPQHVQCGVRGCPDACAYAQAALELPGVYLATVNKRSLTLRDSKGKVVGEYAIPSKARKAIDAFDEGGEWPLEAYGPTTFGPLPNSQTRKAIKKRAKAIREGKIVVEHGKRRYPATGRNTGIARDRAARLTGTARQAKAQEAMERDIAE